MNTPNVNIRRVINAINNELALGKRVKFDMRLWINNEDCGTTACIGGFCGMFAADDAVKADKASEKELYSMTWSDTLACDFLGVTYEQGSKIFYEYPSIANDNEMKRIAIKMLEHLIATGKVNWEIAQ